MSREMQVKLSHGELGVVSNSDDGACRHYAEKGVILGAAERTATLQITLEHGQYLLGYGGY